MDRSMVQNNCSDPPSIVGDILQVIETIDVKKTGEYMIAAREGMYFVKITSNNKDKNFMLEVDSSEFYFKNEAVKGAFEYTNGKIIAVT